MNPKEFEREMRKFEHGSEDRVPPDTYIVARLDIKSGHTLTAELLCEKPFDHRFHDVLVATARQIMVSGEFRPSYAYMQSDEVSILFHKDMDHYGRRVQKLVSLLAAKASANASILMEVPVQFDCRLVLLPTLDRVVDYFSWRQADASRNCLNSWAYWTLRKVHDMGGTKATKQLLKANREHKHKILFENNIIYNSIPTWQRLGTGLLWKSEGSVDRKGDPVIRRKCVHEDKLVAREAYRKFLMDYIVRYEDGCSL